jgi:hypothetical protein
MDISLSLCSGHRTPARAFRKVRCVRPPAPPPRRRRPSGRAPRGREAAVEELHRAREEAEREREEAERARDEAARGREAAVEELHRARAGVAESLLRRLAERGLALSEEQHRRVVSCEDFGRLLRWLDRASSSATAEDVLSA